MAYLSSGSWDLAQIKLLLCRWLKVKYANLQEQSIYLVAANDPSLDRSGTQHDSSEDPVKNINDPGAHLTSGGSLSVLPQRATCRAGHHCISFKQPKHINNNLTVKVTCQVLPYLLSTSNTPSINTTITRACKNNNKKRIGLLL